MHSGYLSLQFSGNIAVLKTRPGYASGIAYEIDEHKMPSVLATVAGDDTILLVLKEGADRSEFRREITTVLSVDR